MEEFKLLKTTNVKGLFVYCTKCRSNLSSTCGLSAKKISLCKFKEKHKYKLRICVPGNESFVKTKVFETRDVNEVVIQAYAYRVELENCNYMPVVHETKTVTPTSITEAMAFYLAYLNNDTPHQQEHKQRTIGHIKEVERYFIYFGNYLKSIKINPSICPFEKLDRDIVGKLKSYLLEKKKFAPKTYNKYIGLMKVFVNYIIYEFDFKMKNPFKTFKSLQTEININTITKNEFTALLERITPENGVKNYQSNAQSKIIQKCFYKPWLKDAMLLAILTGRRREEIVNLKFNGIIEDSNGEPEQICIEDFKVNRSKNISSKEKSKMIYIPIISRLKRLLMDLGYHEHKGKDMFILAPSETMQRKTMMNFISKAFTHYYGQLETGKKLNFYDLRKTYISHLFATHGENARIVTKHAGTEVMFNHYIDNKVIADVALNFEIFDL